MPASSASSPLNSALPPASAGPLRLTLVEDDATIHQLLHGYLDACPGFDCVIIADSIEKLWRELAMSMPPQLTYAKASCRRRRKLPAGTQADRIAPMCGW
jgi:hypothetical protein